MTAEASFNLRQLPSPFAKHFSFLYASRLKKTPFTQHSSSNYKTGLYKWNINKITSLIKMYHELKLVSMILIAYFTSLLNGFDSLKTSHSCYAVGEVSASSYCPLSSGMSDLLG